jgi:ribosomal protein L37E
MWKYSDVTPISGGGKYGGTQKVKCGACGEKEMWTEKKVDYCADCTAKFARQREAEKQKKLNAAAEKGGVK